MKQRLTTLLRLSTGLLAGTLLLSLTGGCANYKLGSMLPDDIKTVHVPTIVNQSNEPQVEGTITQALVVELQRDGSLQVVGRRQADAILEVTLKDYSISPIGFDRQRETRADEYRVYLTASVVMTRTSDGKVLSESPRIRGDATFPFSGDLTTTKRSALPRASQDLAHDIVEFIVEAWM